MYCSQLDIRSSCLILQFHFLALCSVLRVSIKSTVSLLQEPVYVPSFSFGMENRPSLPQGYIPDPGLTEFQMKQIQQHVIQKASGSSQEEECKPKKKKRKMTHQERAPVRAVHQLQCLPALAKLPELEHLFHRTRFII